MKVQKLNHMQARWALYLSRFDFTLKHISETKIGKMDRLSKRLDWKVEVVKDNENQKLIKKEQICNLAKVVIEGPKIAGEKDKEVVEVMKKAGVKVLKDDEQQVERDLVLKEGKIYVLKDEKLRVEIIWLYHDMLVVGYRRRQKIMELVKINYWWPEIMKDIDSCNLCQRIKNKIEILIRKLKLSERLEKLYIVATTS